MHEIYSKHMEERRNNYNELLKNQMNQIKDVRERFKFWHANCINVKGRPSKKKFPILYQGVKESGKIICTAVELVQFYSSGDKEGMMLELMSYDSLYISLWE